MKSNLTHSSFLKGIYKGRRRRDKSPASAVFVLSFCPPAAFMAWRRSFPSQNKNAVFVRKRGLIASVLPFCSRGGLLCPLPCFFMPAAFRLVPCFALLPRPCLPPRSVLPSSPPRGLLRIFFDRLKKLYSRGKPQRRKR